MADFTVKMKQRFENPTKEVSERMRGVKSRGTGLEKAMEEILNGDVKEAYQAIKNDEILDRYESLLKEETG